MSCTRSPPRAPCGMLQVALCLLSPLNLVEAFARPLSRARATRSMAHARLLFCWGLCLLFGVSSSPHPSASEAGDLFDSLFDEGKASNSFTDHTLQFKDVKPYHVVETAGVPDEFCVQLHVLGSVEPIVLEIQKEWSPQVISGNVVRSLSHARHAQRNALRVLPTSTTW